MMSQKPLSELGQGAQMPHTLDDFLNLPGIAGTFGAIAEQYGERLTGDDTYKEPAARPLGGVSGFRAYLSVTVDGQQAGALRAETLYQTIPGIVANVNFYPDMTYFGGDLQMADNLYRRVLEDLAAKATQNDGEMRELLLWCHFLLLERPNFEANAVTQRAMGLNYLAARETARAFKTPEFQRALKEFTTATQTIEAQKQALEAQRQELRQALIGSGAVAAVNYATSAGLLPNNQ